MTLRGDSGIWGVLRETTFQSLLSPLRLPVPPPRRRRAGYPKARSGPFDFVDGARPLLGSARARLYNRVP